MLNKTGERLGISDERVVPSVLLLHHQLLETSLLRLIPPEVPVYPLRSRLLLRLPLQLLVRHSVVSAGRLASTIVRREACESSRLGS